MFWVVGDEPSDHGSVFTKSLAVFPVVTFAGFKVMRAVVDIKLRIAYHGVINDHERIGVHADTNVCLTAVMVVQTVFVCSNVNEFKMLDVCEFVHVTCSLQESWCVLCRRCKDR